MDEATFDLISKPWIKKSLSFRPDKTAGAIRLRRRFTTSQRRPSNKSHLGKQIDSIELDHIVRTEPQDNKQRRTLLVTRTSEREPWGFTLQSYGLHNREKNEIEVLTYVDYVAIGCPAQVAGLRQGDVILSINGKDVETYDHKELVSYIRKCGNHMRMVVLFEDCVRKVELHMRYLKLQRLLAAKTFELHSLEQREKLIKSGHKDIDPRRLSLASCQDSVWNDNISFLSLRPELELFPRNSPRDLHSSSSVQSLNHSMARGTLDSSQRRHKLRSAQSALSLEGNLQSSSSSGSHHRNEYSHSSLPSSARLKVNANRAKHDNPVTVYGTQQRRKRHPSKARPRSLAVTAISEDGDYNPNMETSSVSVSDLSDISSINSSVFSNGQPNLTSTPVSASAVPAVRISSSSSIDQEYKLPPPGATPKFLHHSSDSWSTSHPQMSHGSSYSSLDDLPKQKKKKTKSIVAPPVAQFSQPSHAIMETMNSRPTEPILLKFKPLNTYLNSPPYSSEPENDSDSSDKAIEEDIETNTFKPGSKAFLPPDLGFNSCLCNTTSPTGFDFRSPGAYSADNESPSPKPITNGTEYMSFNPLYTSDAETDNLAYSMSDLQVSADSGICRPVSMDSLSSSSSSGAIKMNQILSSDEDPNELSLEQEIFESLRDKGLSILDNSKNTPPLEYINEEDECTHL